MLFQTDKMLEEEIYTAKIAENQGLDVVELNKKDIAELEPHVKIEAKGATYYRCDSHSTPHEFMEEMKAYLIANGVEFFSNEKVIDFNIQGDKLVSVITDKQLLNADEIVLASGTWTNLLSKKIGVHILLQAGKGYRINSEQNTKITIPAILAEAKVAITPMNGFTRFAGTMEIAGINPKINKARVDAIANATKKYYPEVNISDEEKLNAECGLRPLSFDGLPYIGKPSKCKNLTIATGHAMMGWTMATATGMLVSEIISNKKPSLKLEPFAVERKY